MPNVSRVLLLIMGLALCPPAPARAQAPQDEVVYIDTDGIGSVRMVTDANANVVERHDFQPFGQETPSPSGSNPLFAGKERDQSGFDYSGARYFAAKLGRFTSVDPVNGKAGNPQSWNRYVYAFSSPLRFIDGDGREGALGGDAMTCSLGATFCVSVVECYTCENRTSMQDPFTDFFGIPFFGVGYSFGSNRGDSMSAEASQAFAAPAPSSPSQPPKPPDPPVTPDDLSSQPNKPGKKASTLGCVAANATGGGIVGALVGGAGAIAAGSPLLPYSWFGPAISGGGRSGGTSVISAVARGLLGRSFVNQESGVVWRTLSVFEGTANRAAIVGRVASEASIVAGVALEAYSAYNAYAAYHECTRQD